MSDVETEQAYVSMLYGRLDRLRERAAGWLAETLAGGVATPDQSMSERDSSAAGWSRRIGQLDAAENGLCFGRLDLEDGERRTTSADLHDHDPRPGPRPRCRTPLDP